MALETTISDTLQSKVSFQIKKLGFLTVKGTISDIQGNIVFDENELENSHFNVSISPITINTGNNKRDEHLKSKDFFYVKEFPKVSFQSTVIKKVDNQLLVVGQLTILKQTKEISISFISQNGLLNGNFSINRNDYGLGVKFPSFVVGKTVQININHKINYK